MATSILWGFGGVKFAHNGTEIELPDCRGTLGFTEEKTSHQTKAKTTIIVHDGFRPIISIKMLNIGHATATAGKMAALISLLSASKTSGLMIYPRFEGTGSLGYLCQLKSSIEPKDFSYNVPVGQELELIFEGMALIPQMPTSVSDPNYAYWVDGNGNNIVDKNGNKFIFATKD